MVAIKEDLQCFVVPTYVYLKGRVGLRQEGFKTPTKIPLQELDVDTLNQLCDEFRDNVFEEAGKVLSE